MYLKILACEVAARELYYAAARSTNIVDLEFLSQGHHDTPASGRVDMKRFGWRGMDDVERLWS